MRKMQPLSGGNGWVRPVGRFKMPELRELVNTYTEDDIGWENGTVICCFVLFPAIDLGSL